MITINGRFVGKTQTGVQRYAREITLALDALLAGTTEQAEILIPTAVENDLPLRAITARRGKPADALLWTQLVVPFLARGFLVSLENIGSLLRRRQVVCVHDLSTELFPESYSKAFRLYYRLFMPLNIKRAGHIASVSAFSAEAIVKAGYCTRDKITVIPNGHEHVRRWDASRSAFAKPGQFPRPFVFILGSRAKHKNVAIIESIAAAIDALGLDILVAGPRNGPFSRMAEGEGARNVRLLGFVSDDDLAALYSQAFCFLFPSLTEGFGLPALEAMALGCPSVVSDRASLPEVCGDAALYADPTDGASWLAALKRLRDEPGLRETLTTRGREQARKFSWPKSAQLYLDLAKGRGRAQA